MSTLLYFLPRENRIPVQSHDELVAAGCGHADPDRQGGHSNITESGPGGQRGAIWTQKLPDGNDGSPPVYDAKTQTWRKHPSGKFWVGFSNDARPTPETLRRSRALMGETPVKLLDGEEWIVPVCAPHEFSVIGSSLPQEYDVDDNSGEIVAKTRRDFEAIANRVYEAFATYIGMTPHPLADAWAKKRKPTKPEQVSASAHAKRQITLAADLLALNYRIGEFEAIALLKLFGSEEYFNVVRAAFEAEALDEESNDETPKESASDASPISSGSTAGAEAAAEAVPGGSATSK